jgi:glycosyltransferase involved in cell wall biosynthesis
VVTVGRLEQLKGVETIIRSVAILRDTGDSVGLVIVGNGSDRERLRGIVANLNLEERVWFAGQVERERLPQLISACDVYASGSWQEGFSVALLEALACGLPAVSTPAGGASEVIVEGKTGFLTGPNDPDQMAVAIADALAISQGAAAACVDMASNYSTARVGDRILSLLHSLRDSSLPAARLASPQ